MPDERSLGKLVVIDADEELEATLKIISIKIPILPLDHEFNVSNEVLTVRTVPEGPEIGYICVFFVELIVDGLYMGGLGRVVGIEEHSSVLFIK